jgi:UDP-N-acetylglucosamine 2-epimerase (non-hydrolysing)/GDP/UDP-N,N'-diacetylbacillosamine 2-epimerase (hydrolysing)
VNIGSRQEGRLRGENVLDADYNADNIFAAMRRCLYDEDFRARCHRAENPYWLGDAGPKIAGVLATVPLDQRIIRKRMTLKGEMLNGWYR